MAAAANDLLVGGPDNDTVRGDAGNDTIYWNVGDGRDVINGDTGAANHRRNDRHGEDRRRRLRRNLPIYARTDAVGRRLHHLQPGTEIVITRNGEASYRRTR